MTWRDRLRERLGTDADLDREEWIFAWVTWLLTLVLFPAALVGGRTLRVVAFATVAGCWLGGAFLSWREYGGLQVLEHDE